jgi:hypothetical protein
LFVAIDQTHRANTNALVYQNVSQAVSNPLMLLCHIYHVTV